MTWYQSYVSCLCSWSSFLKLVFCYITFATQLDIRDMALANAAGLPLFMKLMFSKEKTRYFTIWHQCHWCWTQILTSLGTPVPDFEFRIFPSSRLVALPSLESPMHSRKRGGGFIPLPKGINAKWNANSFVKNFTLGCLVHISIFLQWPLFYPLSFLLLSYNLCATMSVLCFVDRCFSYVCERVFKAILRCQNLCF